MDGVDVLALTFVENSSFVRTHDTVKLDKTKFQDSEQQTKLLKQSSRLEFM